jgi:phosphoribosylanthranilate isomerase
LTDLRRGNVTCVKICGITNAQDAFIALEAGADLLGLNFFPPSPRFVTPQEAGQIVRQIRGPHPTACLVGVFVDEDPASVQQIMARCDLDYAQLHGEEPPEWTTALLDRGLKVIKAFRVRDGTSLAGIERHQATAYLLDTYVPGQAGGTGQTFDWQLATQASARGPVILAGGLTPANVAEAIRTARPWGVDVASGVEAEPGRKDPTMVRQFIAAAKGTMPGRRARWAGAAGGLS